jgi:hypothetical protein
MLGELIYEPKGRITGQRVLDVEGPKIEVSFSASGVLKDSIEVIENATYWNVARDPGKLYGEGQGVLMTKDGSDHGTWKGNGIGTMSGNGKTSFRGAIYFGNTSVSKLEFLNNIVGVYEYETDENGNTSAKIWQWK